MRSFSAGYAKKKYAVILKACKGSKKDTIAVEFIAVDNQFMVDWALR